MDTEPIDWDDPYHQATADVRKLVEVGLMATDVAAARVVDGLDPATCSDLAKSFLTSYARDHLRSLTRQAECRAQAMANTAKRKEQELREKELAPLRRQEREASNLKFWGHKEDPTEDERDERQNRQLQKWLDDYAETKHVEWTNELLASGFVVSGGVAVTWGDATIAQHRDRCAMFATNVKSNADGYARHALAIEELEASGCASLNELVVQAAA